MEYKLSLTVVFAVILRSTVLFIEAAPTPTTQISYIQDIDVSYENGKWVCGGMDCPADTYGCRIQRRNNAEDITQLDVISTCFDEDKKNIRSAAKTIELTADMSIDIDVESYIGAVSVHWSSYGSGGQESAHGTIAPNDWSDFKKSAAKNKEVVEGTNASLNK